MGWEDKGWWQWTRLELQRHWRRQWKSRQKLQVQPDQWHLHLESLGSKFFPKDCFHRKTWELEVTSWRLCHAIEWKKRDTRRMSRLSSPNQIQTMQSRDRNRWSCWSHPSLQWRLQPEQVETNSFQSRQTTNCHWIETSLERWLLKQQPVKS